MVVQPEATEPSPHPPFQPWTAAPHLYAAPLVHPQSPDSAYVPAAQGSNSGSDAHHQLYYAHHPRLVTPAPHSPAFNVYQGYEQHHHNHLQHQHHHSHNYLQYQHQISEKQQQQQPHHFQHRQQQEEYQQPQQQQHQRRHHHGMQCKPHHYQQPHGKGKGKGGSHHFGRKNGKVGGKGGHHHHSNRDGKGGVQSKGDTSRNSSGNANAAADKSGATMHVPLRRSRGQGSSAPVEEAAVETKKPTIPVPVQAPPATKQDEVADVFEIPSAALSSVKG